MMDRLLWEKAVGFHGVSLLELVQKEQGTFPGQPASQQDHDEAEGNGSRQALAVGSARSDTGPSDNDAFLTSGSSKISSKSQQVQEFSEKIKVFIAKKADMLFKSEDLLYCSPSSSNQDGSHYAVTPPIEQFMKTHCKHNYERTFSFIAVNDVMIGKVLTLKEFGLFVRLLCFCGDKQRWFTNINVVALLPVAELCDRYSKSVKVEDFSVGDLVRCQVLKVTPEGKVVVSLKAQDNTTETDLFLGLIEVSDAPVHYLRGLELDESFESYDKILRSSVGFDNPYCLDSLIPVLGLQEKLSTSLMRGLQRSAYDESELAEGLNAVQSAKWSMEIVAKGVVLFKSGDYMQAVAKFDKALQMYPKNIEALVARGALYANRGSLTKAIEDFESALKLNCHHRNATKYLIETLIENAKELECQDNVDEATVCYQRVLRLNENHAEARRCLEKIHQDRVKASQPKPAKTPPMETPPKASSERALQRFMMEKSTGALKDFLKHELSYKDKTNEKRKKRNSERSKRSRSPRKNLKKKHRRRRRSFSSSSSSPSQRHHRHSRRSSSSSSSTSSTSSSQRSYKKKRRKSESKEKIRANKSDSSDEKRGRRRNSSRRSFDDSSRNGSKERKRRGSKEEGRNRSRSSSRKDRDKSSNRKNSYDHSPTSKKHKRSKEKSKTKKSAFEWVEKNDGTSKETSKKINKPRKSRSRSSSVEFISEIFLGKLKKEDLDKQEVERRKKELHEQKLLEEKRQREILDNLNHQEASTSNMSSYNVAYDHNNQGENLKLVGTTGAGTSHLVGDVFKEDSSTCQPNAIGVIKRGYCSGSNCGTSDEEGVTDLLKSQQKAEKILKEKGRKCSGSNCGTSDEEESDSLKSQQKTKKLFNEKKRKCSGSNCGTSDEEESDSLKSQQVAEKVIKRKKRKCSGSNCGTSDEEESDSLKSQQKTMKLFNEKKRKCSGSNCGTSDEEESDSLKSQQKTKKLFNEKKRKCSGSNCGTSDEEEGDSLKSQQKIEKVGKEKGKTFSGSNGVTSDDSDEVIVTSKPDDKCQMKESDFCGLHFAASEDENLKVKKEKKANERIHVWKSMKRRDSDGNEKRSCSSSDDDDFENVEQKLQSHSKQRLSSPMNKLCKNNQSPKSSSSYSISISSSSSSSSSTSPSSSSSPTSSPREKNEDDDDNEEEDDDEDLEAYRIDDPESIRNQVLDMQKISFKGQSNITAVHPHRKAEDHVKTKDLAINCDERKLDSDQDIKPTTFSNYDEQPHRGKHVDKSGAARLKFLDSNQEKYENREKLTNREHSKYIRGRPYDQYDTRKISQNRKSRDNEPVRWGNLSSDSGQPKGYHRHQSFRDSSQCHGDGREQSLCSGGSSPYFDNRGSSPYNRYNHQSTGGRAAVHYGDRQSSSCGRHNTGERQSVQYRKSPDNRFQFSTTHEPNPGTRSRHHFTGDRSSPDIQDVRYQSHRSDEVSYGSRHSPRYGYKSFSPDIQYHGADKVPYGRYHDSSKRSSRFGFHDGSPDRRYQYHSTGAHSSRRGHPISSYDRKYQHHMISESLSKSRWTANDFIERDKTFWLYYKSFHPNPLGATSDKREVINKLYERDFKSASFAAATSRVGLKKPHQIWWSLS